MLSVFHRFKKLLFDILNHVHIMIGVSPLSSPILSTLRLGNLNVNIAKVLQKMIEEYVCQHTSQQLSIKPRTLGNSVDLPTSSTSPWSLNQPQQYPLREQTPARDTMRWTQSLCRKNVPKCTGLLWQFAYIWDIVVTSFSLLLLKFDGYSSHWSLLNATHQVSDEPTRIRGVL